jgi:hypothetical protein
MHVRSQERLLMRRLPEFLEGREVVLTRCVWRESAAAPACGTCLPPFPWVSDQSWWLVPCPGFSSASAEEGLLLGAEPSSQTGRETARRFLQVCALRSLQYNNMYIRYTEHSINTFARKLTVTQVHSYSLPTMLTVISTHSHVSQETHTLTSSLMWCVGAVSKRQFSLKK